MTSKVLIDTLVQLAGGEHHGDHVRLGRDAETTLFVAFGSEALIIERVTSLDCKQDVVVATTHRHEQWVLGYEDIRAVRVTASANKNPIMA